jgi:hypothetical protein
MDATGTEARGTVQVLFRRLFSTARLRGRIPLVFGRNGTCTGTTGTWKTSPRRRRADLGIGGWAAGVKTADRCLETTAGGEETTSLRDRLLELGRAAGVEAPPASVLEDLEAFAMAAGIGGAGIGEPGVLGSKRDTRRKGKKKNEEGNADAGAIGLGWSVDESADETRPRRRPNHRRRRLNGLHGT